MKVAICDGLGLPCKAREQCDSQGRKWEPPTRSQSLPQLSYPFFSVIAESNPNALFASKDSAMEIARQHHELRFQLRLGILSSEFLLADCLNQILLGENRPSKFQFPSLQNP